MSCSVAANMIISSRVHHDQWHAEHKIRLIKGAAPQPASALLSLPFIETALESISSGLQGESRLTPMPGPLLAVTSPTSHMLGHKLPPSFLHRPVPSFFPSLCHSPFKNYFMCMNVLLVCIHVHPVHAAPTEAEEGVRSPVTGVTGGCEPECG